MSSTLIPENSVRRPGVVGLEQRVLARFRSHRLAAASTVIVGFSGGPDSLALAALLGRLADRGGPWPRLVHVDHGLRPSSAAEAEQAGDLAAALALPFEAARLVAEPRLAHPGVGLEEAARRERYRVLADAAAAHDAIAVVIAHHQDDQAETVLLHLLRGAGLSGAAGMAEWASLTVPWWESLESGRSVVIWRPFLDEPKAVVRAYADRLGLAPIEDPSNSELDMRRNALRAEFLPAMNRMVPGATAALARYGRLAAADDALLDELTEGVYHRAVGEAGELNRPTLAGEPLALRRRVVRRWLRERAPRCEMSAERTEAVLRLIDEGGSGRRIEIGNHVTVRIAAKVARVEMGVSSGGEDGT